MDAPRRGNRKRPVAVVVYLIDTVMNKNRTNKKKLKIGRNFSLAVNDPTTTVPARTKPKLRLMTGKKFNIDLFQEPPSETISSIFR